MWLAVYGSNMVDVFLLSEGSSRPPTEHISSTLHTVMLLVRLCINTSTHAFQILKLLTTIFRNSRSLLVVVEGQLQFIVDIELPISSIIMSILHSVYISLHAKWST